MKQNIADILKEALKLPPEARAALAGTLLDSLDDTVYRERSLSAAHAFLAELDRAIEKIAEDPGIWPRYFAGTQRFLLQRFPFSVVYRLVSNRIEVVAVAHGRGKPGS